MFTALTKAFGDLRDPRLMRTLLAIAAWSAGVFVVVLIALAVGIDQAALGDWVHAHLTWMPGWFVDALAIAIAGLAYIGLLWFGFIIVSQNIAAFYLDGVVERVEALDYPGLPKAKGSSIVNDVTAMLRFTGVLLVLNIVALPFYVVGLFFPPVAVAIFYLLNGYLFGREYAEVVILRRMAQKEAKAWRVANRTRVWLAGALIAFAMTLPLLNFLGPVIAAAFMTHVYHGSRKTGAVDNPAAR